MNARSLSEGSASRGMLQLVDLDHWSSATPFEFGAGALSLILAQRMIGPWIIGSSFTPTCNGLDQIHLSYCPFSYIYNLSR